MAPIFAWNIPAQIAALKAGFFVTGYLGAGKDHAEAVIMHTLDHRASLLLPPMPEAPDTTEPAPAGLDTN